MDEESIVSLLGLNLPKVYAVNRFTEWAQTELKEYGLWERVAPFSVALPFLVSLVLSSVGEQGWTQVIQSGLIYGAAAIALHHFHGGDS